MCLFSGCSLLQDVLQSCARGGGQPTLHPSTQPSMLRLILNAGALPAARLVRALKFALIRPLSNAQARLRMLRGRSSGEPSMYVYYWRTLKNALCGRYGGARPTSNTRVLLSSPPSTFIDLCTYCTRQAAAIRAAGWHVHRSVQLASLCWAVQRRRRDPLSQSTHKGSGGGSSCCGHGVVFFRKRN